MVSFIIANIFIGINELIYFSFNPSSIENKNVIDYESIPSICLTQVNELESLRQLCDLGGYRKELLKLSSDRVYVSTVIICGLSF